MKVALSGKSDHVNSGLEDTVTDEVFYLHFGLQYTFSTLDCPQYPPFSLLLCYFLMLHLCLGGFYVCLFLERKGMLQSQHRANKDCLESAYMVSFPFHE